MLGKDGRVGLAERDHFLLDSLKDAEKRTKIAHPNGEHLVYQEETWPNMVIGDFLIFVYICCRLYRSM